MKRIIFTFKKSPAYKVPIAFMLKLRRLYYKTFKRKYTEEQLRLRKGKCNQCGCCENLNLLFLDCKDFKDGKCMVHGEHPKSCQTYPFDEKDKLPWLKEQCGYYWDNSKKQSFLQSQSKIEKR